jgi:hypothetical protein
LDLNSNMIKLLNYNEANEYNNYSVNYDVVVVKVVFASKYDKSKFFNYFICKLLRL